MKVKFTDRLLLTLYAIVGMLLSLGGGAFLILGIRNGWTLSVSDILFYNPQMNMLLNAIIGAVLVVLLVWSLWVLLLAFRHEPRVDKASVSVQNTEHGSVRVSVQAMDMLVKQAIGNTDGVVDVKTRIINHEDSITVNVDMTLDSDVHIPNVTMLMQRSIKNFIEEYSGIAVREVTILVSKIIEVTPHPPLKLEAKTAPEIIDQPDAIEPEPITEPEEPAPEAEIEDLPPVEEFEADHEPDAVDAQQGETEDEQSVHISEKDLW